MSFLSVCRSSTAAFWVVCEKISKIYIVDFVTKLDASGHKNWRTNINALLAVVVSMLTLMLWYQPRFVSCKKRTGMLRIWRAREREPIWGSGGGAPSGVQGQSPWSGGAKPPEAEGILLPKRANLSLSFK